MGDVNGDGTVDSADLDVIKANACLADFSCDGIVDPDDLADYITCFFTSGCGDADISGDGIVDPDDLADYITAFFGGCA